MHCVVCVLAECTIKFTYTPKYPDEAPLMEIESSENLDEEQQDMVLQFINEQVTFGFICCVCFSENKILHTRKYVCTYLCMPTLYFIL